MGLLPAEEKSLWLHTVGGSSYPGLKGDLEVDTVIVGGGLAGLNTAYQLKQAGQKVAVLEKETVGSQVSGHITGKVTSQHGLIYTDLTKRFGEKIAQHYADANQAGFAETEKLITHHKIACDWQVDDNYVFTENSEKATKLKQESQAAKRLGLPADYVTKTGLPFRAAGAVRFKDQAKLHTPKYLQGLAKLITGQGSYVFEHSKVRRVRDGEPVQVKTSDGTVTARQAIIATHVPFSLTAHGAYCAVEYPTESYVVAGKLKQPLKGMYITPSSPIRSILPVTISKQAWLLVGGESHVPGLGWGRIDARYRNLASYASERFGIKKIEYRWKTMDYQGYDSLPLVGKLYPWSKHVYVSTAFAKWGLTNSMAAALILRDAIFSQPNPWAKTFDSIRLSAPASIPRATIRYLKR